MINKTNWTEYTGADEQITDLGNAKNGFVWRDSTGYESIYKKSLDYLEINERVRSILNDRQVTHYWLIPAAPLREMKIRWAQTGQPVWTRRKIENEYFYWLPTTTPDWNIPNAEYSFIEFEKSVDK